MVEPLASKPFTAAPFSHCVSWLSTYTSFQLFLAIDVGVGVGTGVGMGVGVGVGAGIGIGCGIGVPAPGGITIKVPRRGPVCAGALKPTGVVFDNPLIGMGTVVPA